MLQSWLSAAVRLVAVVERNLEYDRPLTGDQPAGGFFYSLIWYNKMENKKMNTTLFNNNPNFVPALPVSGSVVVSIAAVIIIAIVISVIIIITPPGAA